MLLLMLILMLMLFFNCWFQTCLRLHMLSIKPSLTSVRAQTRVPAMGQ